LTTRATHALRLVAAAALFSTAGAAIKSCTLSGLQVACFRAGIAAVTIFALMPEARRRWTWAAAPVSLAYAACMSLFVLSTKLTTAANAIFLQSTWSRIGGALILGATAFKTLVDARRQ
jgi:DME family drug/metabolite transporter